MRSVGRSLRFLTSTSETSPRAISSSFPANFPSGFTSNYIVNFNRFWPRSSSIGPMDLFLHRPHERLSGSIPERGQALPFVYAEIDRVVLIKRSNSRFLTRRDGKNLRDYIRKISNSPQNSPGKSSRKPRGRVRLSSRNCYAARLNSFWNAIRKPGNWNNRIVIPRSRKCSTPADFASSISKITTQDKRYDEGTLPNHARVVFRWPFVKAEANDNPRN